MDLKDQLLKKIGLAVAEGDWKTVKTLSRQILSSDPDNNRALTFHSLAEQELSDIDDSADITKEKEEVLPVSFIGDRYRVKELVGEGARKKVYLCRDATLDRDIAFSLVKTEGLDADTRKRVMREAQVMGRLVSHPHIVSVFDMGEENGQPYIVTEYMEGGDVETHMDDAPGRRLPLTKVLDIAKSICRGLEFAHSQTIVHRDLKPSNVWLTFRGEAKIGDFGVALSLDHSRFTQEGTILETLSYMPPEQATGGAVTALSDLYSLGAMLYEMVTGRPPFMGDDSIGIIEQHINTPPVAPAWHNPECPKALEALIVRLLAKNPTERPASASEVLFEESMILSTAVRSTYCKRLVSFSISIILPAPLTLAIRQCIIPTGPPAHVAHSCIHGSLVDGPVPSLSIPVPHPVPDRPAALHPRGS